MTGKMRKQPQRELATQTEMPARTVPVRIRENETDRKSAAITRGLGGKANISDVDCCATRLRCSVNDPSLVDDRVLRATGASGIVHRGNGVQIIYGPRVTIIKSDLMTIFPRDLG